MPASGAAGGRRLAGRPPRRRIRRRTLHLSGGEPHRGVGEVALAQPDCDLWLGPAERGRHRLGQRGLARAEHTHPQHPAARGPAHALGGELDAGQQAAGLGEQHRSRLGEPHPLRGPLEQRAAQLGLQLTDTLAQRWLRHVQTARRATDVALLGNRDKILQPAHIHGSDDTHTDAIAVASETVLDAARDPGM